MSSSILASLFPAGTAHYLIGGLSIGAGVALIFLTTGIVAGASGFYSSTLSWISRRPCFREPFHLSSRGWRLVFSAGLLLGALLWSIAGEGGRFWSTEVPLWRLASGGFLVGLGTRLSRGCTSGHGICGLSAWSLPSLLSVVTFMGVAIVTAALTRALGLAP